MFVLFTDYGPTGPYMGQLHAVLARDAPGIPVIDLLSDAPAHDARAAAYLLDAWRSDFPTGAVFICVVDPGVGTFRERPVAIHAGGQWFVGPDNGLFNTLLKREPSARIWEIVWRPAALSASFHGRDLYAPAAARIFREQPPTLKEVQPRPLADWPDDLPQIVYIDYFGNAMTGIRASAVPREAALAVHGRRLPRCRTFGDVPRGEPLCYENSSGLLEIAVNCGRADQALGLARGDPVTILPPD